jgi:hypothetical protein
MNQRIRELVKKAGSVTQARYKPPGRSKVPGEIWEPGHVPWNDIYNEEFAKLVAEECSQHLAQIGQNYASWAVTEHFKIKQEDCKDNKDPL